VRQRWQVQSQAGGRGGGRVEDEVVEVGARREGKDVGVVVVDVMAGREENRREEGLAGVV
jgi:hypothetical protein